jgi:hypothetical protein
MVAHLDAIKQFRLQIYPLPMPISDIRHWVGLNVGTPGCYKAVLASNLPSPSAYLCHQTLSGSQYWHTSVLKSSFSFKSTLSPCLCQPSDAEWVSIMAHLGAIKQFRLQIYPLPMPISDIRRWVGLNVGTPGCCKAVSASNLTSPQAYLCH